MSHIELFRTILSSDPDNAAALLGLGLELAAAQEIAEAREILLRAEKSGDASIAGRARQAVSMLPIPTASIEDLLMEQDGVPMGKEPGKAFTFKDVGGLTELKRIIDMKIIQPFKNPSLFEKFGKRAGGGVLMYGPPGCGKTHVARATAGECNARFYRVSTSDILSKWIGESEEHISTIFRTARQNKPSVIFLDEIDAIAFNRAKLSSENLHGTISQLLTEMDGLGDDMDKVLVFGTTNVPWDVDPAFKRPGRFDRLVFVAPPDLAAREAIFRIKLAGRPVDPGIDTLALAKITDLYSGADIEGVIERATEAVISKIMEDGKDRTISMKELLAAVKNSKASTLEWLHTAKNYVQYANQGGLYDEVEAYMKEKNIR